jgi:hypothetical protein
LQIEYFRWGQSAEQDWPNYSGRVNFHADEYFEPPPWVVKPGSCCRSGNDEGKHLKAIGSGWAYEDIAKSDDWVVCLKQLVSRLDNVKKSSHERDFP